jgi:type I restriction enzyme M protein
MTTPETTFPLPWQPEINPTWLEKISESKDEISFTKYFYEYTLLRSTEEIAAELLALDEETENLLREIVRG